jgi:oxalate decarboxylase
MSQAANTDNQTRPETTQAGTRQRAAFATLLTLTAGFLDASAYVELDHLYVSFMSGNSTHLGMALASGEWTAVLTVSVIVASFVAGAALGTSIGDTGGVRVPTLILAAETVLVLAALALTPAVGAAMALALVAVAMGMQNTLHQVVAGEDVGKSFVTGALFNLGQSIARWLRGTGGFMRAVANFSSWTAFIGGAALGAMTHAALGLQACLAAALVLILAMIIAVHREWL